MAVDIIPKIHDYDPSDRFGRFSGKKRVTMRCMESQLGVSVKTRAAIRRASRTGLRTALRRLPGHPRPRCAARLADRQAGLVRWVIIIDLWYKSCSLSSCNKLAVGSIRKQLRDDTLYAWNCRLQMMSPDNQAPTVVKELVSHFNVVMA